MKEKAKNRVISAIFSLVEDKVISKDEFNIYKDAIKNCSVPKKQKPA